MKATHLYPEMYGIKLSRGLKARIKALSAKQVDTPTLLREAIEAAVVKAESQVLNAG